MISRLFVPMIGLLALAACEHTASSTSTGRPQESAEAPLQHQVSSCWTFDPGWPGLKDMEVGIRAELNPDGSVQSASIIPDKNKLADPNYLVFAESAKRAVLKCSPYKVLTSRPYEAWKIITFDFNAKDMGL